MMIPTAKCPSCGKVVTQVHFEEISAVPGFFSQRAWRSLAYLCPQCRMVLSVQIDPIAIRTEISNHVDQAVAPVAQEVAALRSQVARLEQLLAQLLRSRR